VRLVVAIAIGVLVGTAVEPACCDCAQAPTVAFRCQPNEQPRGDRCPDTHFCCSDDPTTADGAIPAYANKSVEGSTPLFADAANDQGDSGMCVRTEDIPSGSGLLDPRARNCPIPCNPTWGDTELASVCGEARVCCQTVELHEDDCVRDADTNLMRPADGRDALASLDGGTRWNPTRDSTHQDPHFDVCAAHAGDRTGPEFLECISHLTTANQRGYCMSLQPGQVCPTEPETGYRSVCDEMND
jgi:hypothetical protein